MCLGLNLKKVLSFEDINNVMLVEFFAEVFGQVLKFAGKALSLNLSTYSTSLNFTLINI